MPEVINGVMPASRRRVSATCIAGSWPHHRTFGELSPRAGASKAVALQRCQYRIDKIRERNWLFDRLIGDPRVAPAGWYASAPAASWAVERPLAEWNDLTAGGRPG